MARILAHLSHQPALQPDFQPPTHTHVSSSVCPPLLRKSSSAADTSGANVTMAQNFHDSVQANSAGLLAACVLCSDPWGCLQHDTAALAVPRRVGVSAGVWGTHSRPPGGARFTGILEPPITTPTSLRVRGVI